jgi:uncharacterized repeat protein (TIGR03803 family)
MASSQQCQLSVRLCVWPLEEVSLDCFLKASAHINIDTISEGTKSPFARTSMKRTSSQIVLNVCFICTLSVTIVRADAELQIVKSFGFPDLTGENPEAPLIRGSDGGLYGTTYSGGTNGAGTIFRLNGDGTGYHVLHHFAANGSDGQNPRAKLVEGSDGWLYGAALGGGSAGAGALVRVNKDGSGFTLLLSFSPTAGNLGSSPMGVIEASDGALYGTTYYGGPSLVYGTIFKVNKDGTGYTTLHNFGSGTHDGENPGGELVQGSTGALFGTTAGGGSLPGLGTVFKINKDGSGYAILHDFTSGGVQPQAALILGSDGLLYGTTSGGGDRGGGTVFSINQDGSGYTLLHNLDGGTQDPLIEGNDGSLYGSTGGGIIQYFGTVFRVNRDGTGYAILHTFSRGDGDGPTALLQGSDGLFYGTTRAGGGSDEGTLFRVSADGMTYQVLRSFDSSGGDGISPLALTAGRDGSLYGVTYLGGVEGGGTVFTIATNGSGYEIVHSFSAWDTNGSGPRVPVLEGSDGAFYGTTWQGGSGNVGGVFTVAKDGTGYNLLRSFSVSFGQYWFFPSSLIEGSNGMLYGTSEFGGASAVGTAFTVAKNGSIFSVLHDFGVNQGDGSIPTGALIEGSDGWLYGTTSGGGSNGVGSVFRLALDGTGYAILYHFDSAGGGGWNPSGPLLEASDGVLYGLASLGGGGICYPNGCGAVFALNKDGSGFRSLHSFGGNDGRNPSGSLVQGKDGALYGTTPGSGFGGTIFKVATDGSGFVELHSFTGPGDYGPDPSSALVLAADGALYGTIPAGGDLGLGAIFRLAPSLNKVPVPVIKVSPLALFPGRTNLIVIGPDGHNAAVTFDASQSYDPDGDHFNYFWYDESRLFSTNPVATQLFAVGWHAVTLLLDDTKPQGTNTTEVTFQVISLSDAVGIIKALVDASALPGQRHQSLQASLEGSAASFRRRSFNVAFNQLHAFLQKVEAQIAPSNPALAQQLKAAVQIIIDAVPR